MLLRMTGAKSGRSRMTPLEYCAVDERVIFVGTRGAAETNPAWVHNVRAHPNVHARDVTDDSTSPLRRARQSVLDQHFGDNRDRMNRRVVVRN